MELGRLLPLVMRIVRRFIVVVAVVAGCYTPLPQEGAPCESPLGCPTPQRCVAGRCSLRDAPPVDASEPEPPDAPPDASIDAAPPLDAFVPACSTAGLICNATPIMFICGGNCWVRCTENVTRETARQRCVTWMGVLGEVNDAPEQACVAQQVAAFSWFGLQQTAGSTTTGAGWTWNGTTPLGVYNNWLGGKPDDSGGGENGAEQCATIRPGWDDDECNQTHDFFCERPAPASYSGG